MPSTTNTLGVYNPLFYAQEALIQLESAMGMAARVYRGFEAERNSFRQGEYVNIRRPASFASADAPNSTKQDAVTDTVQIRLDQWKEVKFTLTDKELAYTGERIIADHIRPAAVALADTVDQALCAKALEIPHVVQTAAVASDITDAHSKLFDNKVPMDEMRLHTMVNGTLQKSLLDDSTLSEWQGAGSTGEQTQLRGALGRRYGMNFFANQNVTTVATAGTASTTTLAIDNASGYTAGTATVDIDAGAVTGTLVAGDVLQITHSDATTGLYSVTATSTASGNQFTGVTISPPLRKAVDDDAAVALTKAVADKGQCLSFHENFCGLVMAPLPDSARLLPGVNVQTVTDPISGLSIRARVYYDGDLSEVNVALDCLYGLTVLDADLAVRLEVA